MLLKEMTSIMSIGGYVGWMILCLSWFIYWLAFNLLFQLRSEVTKCPKGAGAKLLEQPFLASVNRRIRLLSLLLKTLPLLGLLGTIVGMLKTFEGLAKDASANPLPTVTNGIGEALLTTELALMMVLPGYGLQFLIQYYRRCLKAPPKIEPLLSKAR